MPIKKYNTVDWRKRDEVRAKLRLTVRKILMCYGYRLDLLRLESDKVLVQSESWGSFLVGLGWVILCSYDWIGRGSCDR